MLRDHSPLLIEDFNGLHNRGGADKCPPDHFQFTNNIQYYDGGVRSRDGSDWFGNPFIKVDRAYTFISQTGESVIALEHGTGKLYDSGSPTPNTALITIAGMTDFSITVIAGKAYITPISGDLGVQFEDVYVYTGNGATPFLAGGNPPVDGSKKPFGVYPTQNAGLINPGYYLFGVCYVTAGGVSIMGPEVFPTLLALGNSTAVLFNIPIGAGGTTKRRISCTKALPTDSYDPNQLNHTFYFLIDINDNTTETLEVNFNSFTDLNVDTTSFLTSGTGTVPPTPATQGLLVNLSNSQGGIDTGFRLFAVVYETASGFLTRPGPQFFGHNTGVFAGGQFVLTGIPVDGANVAIKRHIIATTYLPNYTGNQSGFSFFFVPGGTINDNVTTTINLHFYDADLIADATYLFDEQSFIEAGAGIGQYRNRLMVWGEFDNPSIIRFSAVGQPESVDSVDGLIIVPLDGNPITFAQQLRDILYVYKKNRTYAYTDNGDVPASWPLTVIDDGIGCSLHGIGTVLDSGGISGDSLLVSDFSGLLQFNGAYGSVNPMTGNTGRNELTFKIRDTWLAQNKSLFRNIQVINDSLGQCLYILMTDGTLLIGDYSQGFNAQAIKWANWTFTQVITTITLIAPNTLILGTASASFPGLYKIVVGNTNDQLKAIGSGTLSRVGIPSPALQTALFSDEEDQNVLHVGAVRFRVTGTGNFIISLQGLNNLTPQTLATLALSATNVIEQTRLSNFNGQKVSMSLSVAMKDELFNLNRAILFVKPVASSVPG